MEMGYVKLYRKFKEWEWYKEPNMAHLFVHLLIEANHKNQNWRGIEIKRGQLVTGRNSLCSETGISAQSVRTCLNRLKSTNEITIKPTKQFSIITLCNFEKYQLKQPTIQPTIQPTSNQRATNEQPTTNHKQECIKNVYNEKNEEEQIQTNALFEKNKIVLPFNSLNFLQQWELWKQYKKEQFRFIYKPIGEQGALKELAELSTGNEENAIKIILQSIQKGWKGFFQLKQFSQNGNTNSNRPKSPGELLEETIRLAKSRRTNDADTSDSEYGKAK